MTQATTTLVEDVLLHPSSLSFASPESDFTMPHEDDWTSRVARFIEFEALVVLLAISGRMIPTIRFYHPSFLRHRQT